MASRYKHRETEASSGTVRAIDLFAGCGGLSLGLEQAGFNVVAAIEIGKPQAETYRKNHPSTLVVQKDIHDVDCASVLASQGGECLRIDLLAGCPPCQGFSPLRTLNGRYSNEDPRNDLLFEFVRLVREIRPTTVFLENVPELANDARFSSFLTSMSKLGYVGQGKIIDVVDYSVPQSRKRLVYVAGLGFGISIPCGRRKRKTVRDAIGNLPVPGTSGDPLHDWSERHGPKIQKLIESVPKNGGSRDAVPDELKLPCHRKTNGFHDVYGRMAWDSPAPTITGGCVNPSKGRYIHPERNGAITLREAALLQGFPRDYAFTSPNKGQIALMIGNAFPPPAAKAIGKSIIEKLSEVRHGET